MQKDIYDPLKEYVNVYRHKFKEVAEKTFAELAAEAQVDVGKTVRLAGGFIRKRTHCLR